MGYFLFDKSWLVGSPHRCNAGTSVYQAHRVDAFASKPAPTFLIAQCFENTGKTPVAL